MSIWLKRLSIFALVCIAIGFLGTRFTLFSFKVSALLILLSLVLALLTFIVSIIVFFKQRTNSPSNAKHAGVAALLSSIPILCLVLFVVGTHEIPRIHNISTDTQDPPSFVKAHELRSNEHNPLEYNKAEIAPLQQSAYPNIETLVVAMNQAQAYAKALALLETLGWDLVHTNPEQGIIEASQTTQLWGFTDDIVIRLRSNPSDDLVTIDLRSVSRVGVSDLGANAKRIEAFLTQFQADKQ